MSIAEIFCIIPVANYCLCFCCVCVLSLSPIIHYVLCISMYYYSTSTLFSQSINPLALSPPLASSQPFQSDCSLVDVCLCYVTDLSLRRICFVPFDFCINVAT